jgi:hypothetical protein
MGHDPKVPVDGRPTRPPDRVPTRAGSRRRRCHRSARGPTERRPSARGHFVIDVAVQRLLTAPHPEADGWPSPAAVISSQLDLEAILRPGGVSPTTWRSSAAARP